MENEMNSINIIPFVDIMLVLITIVLITSNFMARGLIPVNLPKSEAHEESIREAVTISMTKTGEIYLKDQKVSLEELKTNLSVYDRNWAVLISADKELTLQTFVTVMEILKNYGFTKVSIETER